MGMSIDEALKELNRVILCLTDGGNVTKEVNALEMAVDTMRKYQKIEEVVADFNNQYNHRTALDLMCEVKEVVEDGNDN